MRRLTILIAAGLAMSAGAWASEPDNRPARGSIGPRITVSRDTTFISAPLQADGSVDYVGYLNARYSQGVTRENNAAVRLLEILGRYWIDPQVYEETCRQLGVPAVPENHQYFSPLPWPEELVVTRPAGAPGEQTLNRQLEQATTRPWKPDEFPRLASWLEGNNAAVELAVLASERPRCFRPIVSASSPPTLTEAPPALVSGIMELTNAMLARGMGGFATGDHAAAMADIMGVHRLARLQAQCPLLMDGMIALRTERLANEADCLFLTSGRLSEKQVRTYLAQLKALPEMSDIRHQIANERLYALDLLSRLARGDSKLKTWSPMAAVGIRLVPEGIHMDWDAVLQEYNVWFDKMEAQAFNPNSRSAAEALRGQFAVMGEKAKVQIRILSFCQYGSVALAAIHGARGELLGVFLASGASELAVPLMGRAYGRLLVSVLLPAVSGLVDFQLQQRTRSDLTLVAAMLALHRVKNGAYPKALANLVPAYDKDVPLDRYSGQPLIYRREGNGYILYSVGENGQDDGGKDDPKSGDIVIRAR